MSLKEGHLNNWSCSTGVNRAIYSTNARLSSTDQTGDWGGWGTFSGLKLNKFFLDLMLFWPPVLLTLPAGFPGVEPLGWVDLFIPVCPPRPLAGKPDGVDPGRPRNCQRRLLKLTNGPKILTTINNSKELQVQEKQWNLQPKQHGVSHETVTFEMVAKPNKRFFLKNNCTSTKIN